jgi:hypothetical protein
MIGLWGIIKLDIHPIWVIDENAIIDLSLVWFIPIIAPINALIHGIIISGIDIDSFIINIRIDKGASFCHVDKIIHEIHDNEDITAGNHIWHGTIPSFKIREIMSKSVTNNLSFIRLVHKAEDIIKRMLDPNAWAKKYLSMASDSWNLFELFISGIKDNMLISSAAHVINQLLLEMAITDLIIIREYIRKLNGEKRLAKAVARRTHPAYRPGGLPGACAPKCRRPVPESFTLQIVILRARAGTVSASAGVDCDSFLIGDKAFVALGRAKAKCQSGLYKDVNQVLQDVRNSKVPHWQGNQVPIGWLETADHTFDPLPSFRLIWSMRLAVQDGILGVDGVSIKRGQFRRPEVQLVDLDRRVGLL